MKLSIRKIWNAGDLRPVYYLTNGIWWNIWFILIFIVIGVIGSTTILMIVRGRM